MALLEAGRQPQALNLTDVRIATVELNNCKATNLGTVVQCQGGLQLIQYVKAGKDTAPVNLPALKDLLVKDTTNKFSWKQMLSWKLLLLSIFLAGLVAASTVTTLKLVSRDRSGGEPDSEDDSDDDLPMNLTERFITRGEWGADERRVSDRNPLTFRPAKFVVVIHTAGPDCTKTINCENIVRGMQNYHFDLYGDISYNFLIGGDGIVYEGRGWGRYGAHTYGINCASIGVAFIGDYNYSRLKKRSVDALNLLIAEGVSKGEIAPDYKLFAQSQIFNADSPGLHIMEVIRKWSHWSKVVEDDYVCY